MSASRRGGEPASVAFLTPGDPRHGVTRYANTLAAAVEAAGVAVVHERPRRRGSALSTIAAASRARRSSLVHLQFADRYWGEGRAQVLVVLALRLVLWNRTVVVTAHDFHAPPPRRRSWPLRQLSEVARLRTAYGVAARILLGSVALVLVCSEGEAESLAWTRPRRVQVVPHYVEGRRPLPHGTQTQPPGGAPAGAPLVVLGFIHRRKGQHLAVRALPHLPEHRLVLAGSATPANAEYLESILAEARVLGVEDRLEVTGYLSDDDLVVLLARARAALVPYERIAASGSVATLAAWGVPMIARAQRALDDLARACPSAVGLFEGDDPSALAAAARRTLASPREAQTAELARWADEHSLARTARRHLEAYRAAEGRTREDQPEIRRWT